MDEPQLNKNLGRRLRRFRRIADLTQVQLAEKVGVRFQQIAKYEKAQAQMSPFRLYALAQAIGGVTVADFFNEIEKEI
jgi:transcriptional regulator with XRE-family HTH domain